MKTLQEYGLHHIGFVVPDAEKAANHFSEMYGLDVPPCYSFVPNVAYSYGEKEEEYELKICMIPLGNGNAIEIIEPVRGNGVHRRFVENGGNGMHHICFSVEDYDYWRERFKDARVLFESETEDNIIGYRRCFYAEDEAVGMIYEIKENPYFREK